MYKLLLLFSGLLLSLGLRAQPQRYFVDPAAGGQNNGQSWTDAFTSLHDALALAVAGDEVWVAQGIYRPSATIDRAARFQLLSSVRLYGSFAGTELDPSERTIDQHASMLDGDIGLSGDSSDNSYNLLYLYRPDSLTLVDGFTFRYALADDPAAAAGEPGASGAALYLMAYDGEAYPTIRHCVFEHNAAFRHGGAVYVEGGGSGSVAPVFEDCRFSANRAIQGHGGAIYRNGGSWVDQKEDIKSCIFEENLAYLQGGAIYFADSPRTDTFDITRTLFKHNGLDDPFHGSGIISGSAVFVTPSRLNNASKLSVRQSKAINNISNSSFSDATFAAAPQFFEGGNMIFYLDSVYSERNDGTIYGEAFGSVIFTIKNSVFFDDSIGTNINLLDYYDDTCKVLNTSFTQCFGSIRTKSKTLYVENILYDHCKYAGFAIEYIQNDAEIIANNIISNSNTLSAYGFANTPGLVLHTSTNNFNGPYKGTVRLNNSSAYGGSIYTNLADFIYYRNNAFLLPETAPDPPYGHYYTSPEIIVFDHNIINLPDTFNTPGWINTNNLWNTDPQFVQPDSGDFRLQPCSAAIDAGDNSAVLSVTDLAEHDRILNGTVDMGAYETPAFGLAAAPVIKPACVNTTNGTITPSLISACLPLQVAWQSGSQSGASLDSLAAGAYVITLTDARGHHVAFNAQVPSANPPVLLVDGAPISCFSAIDGRAVVTPLSGQPPFDYVWSPPVTTDSVAMGLPPGPASVTVTDAWGCISGFQYQILQPDSIQITAVVQDASGMQLADGNIAVGVSGGTPPYAYEWSPVSSMGPIVENLLPGLYTLSLTDGHGCMQQQSFNLSYTNATQEAKSLEWIQISPNPAADFTTLSGDFQDRQPASVEMYDSAGRLLYGEEWTDKSRTLSVAGLVPGTYLIFIKDKQGLVIGRGQFIKA